MDLDAAFAPLSRSPVSAPAPQDEDSFEPAEPPAGVEPPAANSKLGRYSHRWAYFGADGALQGYQCRFETPDGKAFRPLRYGTRRGRTGWHSVGWADGRPLYRLSDALDRPAAAVLVVEGEKAADAAAAMLPDMVVVSPMNGAQSPHRTDWGTVAGRTVVVIWPDADEPGRAFACKVGKLAKNAGANDVRIVTVPDGAPDGWDLADALPEGWTAETIERALAEAERFDPDGEVVDAAVQRAEVGSVSFVSAWRPTHAESWADPKAWNDPATLPEGLPVVQPFDLLLLPERLRPWVADVAERMQVPADYPAVAAMITFGTVVGRQIAMRPKEQDDWTVIANLWGGIVGRPGLLKTPALQEACRQLTRLEAAAKDEHQQALEEHEARQRIAKQQKKLQDEQIAKDLKAKRDEAGILHDLLADGQDDPPPARRRYLVNDTTIEKLGEILGANPNGVLIFRDEMTGFLRQMDREGHEADRAFYLEAWNGNGRFTYDRIGRGTLDIEACCVSLLGGIQPGPLAAYLESMARGGAGDDGLMQRLQLLVWPDVGTTWRNVDRVPDLAARRWAAELYDWADAIVPAACGATRDAEGDIPYLRFDPQAQRAFDDYRTGLETQLRAGRLHPAMEAHLAKYRSLVPSLALLCQLADVGTGPVGIVALERALAWAEYLETHARRIYDAVLRADLCSARSLGEHIQAGDLQAPFGLRDVYRPAWSGLATRAAASAAVNVLVDLDWLRVEDISPGAGGGRPTAKYHINPKLGAKA